MKKLLAFLRSMPFANTLLGLIALLCALSSLLPQGRELAYYAERYPGAYLFIYRSHFYDVFHSWYFLLLLGLLSLSMLLCTAGMFRRALRGLRAAAGAASLPNTEALEPGQLEALRRWAAGQRCRESRVGENYVFEKNRLGYWGLFLLHAAILLTMFFGIFALALPTVTDQSCRPGESITMEDGSVIEVETFRMHDGSGKLDYASVIRATLPDGRQSGSQEIKVNYPMTFGRLKIFQWTYGVGGLVRTRNTASGAEQLLRLPVYSLPLRYTNTEASEPART